MGWQVVGHDQAVSLLDRGLREGRLAHAYLIVGPAHVGKMTLALELAKALNCPEPEPPCGSCRSCSHIAQGRHADVEVIEVVERVQEDGTRRVEIGIDQIRELRHHCALKPYEGRCRVFIVNGAEHLSRDAATALLKTLEEPPEDTALVLLTTDPGLLLPTIVSRCQTLVLRPLPQDLVAQEVTRRCGTDPSQAALLARLSRGCPGWALRAAQDPTVLQERESYLERIAGLLEASLEPRLAYAEELANRFGRARPYVREELDLWQEWLGDLLLTSVGRSDLALNQGWRPTLERQGAALSPDQVAGALRLVQDISLRLEENANARLALEVLMLELPWLAASATAR